MSTLSIRLPDSLHKKIKEISKDDGISINQFLSSAAAEKVSAVMTINYLKKEAKLGKRRDFEAVLKKVPNVKPEDYDKIG